MKMRSSEPLRPGGGVLLQGINLDEAVVMLRSSTRNAAFFQTRLGELRHRCDRAA